MSKVRYRVVVILVCLAWLALCAVPVYAQTVLDVCEPYAWWAGLYDPNSNTITMNECAYGTDMDAVYAHEMAHAHGWHHGEGTPETNPAYYDVAPPTN